MKWLSILLVALMMQGCGRAKSASRSAELTMWLVGSEAQAKTVNKLSESFTARTGIAVRCEAISWGEAHSKYLTAVAGGVEPDIGTMGLTWGVEFGRLGALVDLQQAFPEDVAIVERQTFPGLWESAKEGNHIYGIPLDLSLQVLYYRTDLIPAPPKTWDELVSTLERIRKDGKRMIIDWGNISWIGYAPFLWQAGGDFYNASHSVAQLDSPQALQALQFFRDLYGRYDVPKTSIPVEQGLRTGDFPIAISGNWKIVTLTIGAPELADRWAIGLLPKGPSGKRTAFLGGRIMGIFAKSKHPKEAWQFIQYLFEPGVQQQLYEEGLQTQDAYLPPNVATWESLPMAPAMKAVLKQQAGEAKGPPAVNGWTETTHVIEGVIQRAILQDADIASELKKANEAMNQALRSTR